MVASHGWLTISWLQIQQEKELRNLTMVYRKQLTYKNVSKMTKKRVKFDDHRHVIRAKNPVLPHVLKLIQYYTLFSVGHVIRQKFK